MRLARALIGVAVVEAAAVAADEAVDEADEAVAVAGVTSHWYQGCRYSLVRLRYRRFKPTKHGPAVRPCGEVLCSRVQSFAPLIAARRENRWHALVHARCVELCPAWWYRDARGSR
ncbi:MAG: hypothetical protein JXD19_11810 [Deltaproteobacteria bacterium]|nr:hypothetical protein [Deltaproteobacteria bacterium]